VCIKYIEILEVVMRKAVFFVLPLVLLVSAFMAGPAHGAMPELKSAVIIEANGSPYLVDRHATPEVVDWNNDGAKDLLVGCFGYGHITLFLNNGTDLNPEFPAGVKLKSGGVTITTSYS